MIEIKETTDVAPLGIDEPSKVWNSATYFRVPTLPSCGIAFLSAEDVDAFQFKYKEYAQGPLTEPVSRKFSDVLAFVHGQGIPLLILTGTGRVIEEYPV